MSQNDNPVAEALNRIADALFQQAKAHSKQVKLMERQIECAERMEDMQKANLAVTKHLESQLALQMGGGPSGRA